MENVRLTDRHLFIYYFRQREIEKAQERAQRNAQRMGIPYSTTEFEGNCKSNLLISIFILTLSCIFLDPRFVCFDLVLTVDF